MLYREGKSPVLLSSIKFLRYCYECEVKNNGNRERGAANVFVSGKPISYCDECVEFQFIVE